MMKFKKFLAAAMAGAMMLGLAATAAPAVSVYAEGEPADDTTTTTPDDSTIATASFAYDAYDGIPNLIVDFDSLGGGNYIHVQYCTDLEGKKEKSTIIYTADEIEALGGYISLAGVNLKKGASFRVYDELTDKDEVNLVVVEKQSDAIKVKVKDLTQEDLLSALTITIGKTALTDSNAADYVESIYINDELIGSVGSDGKAVMNNELLTALKLEARVAGTTFYAKYVANENCIPSEAKFKIAAAPKAPKITIDYVNGTYTIAKNASYAIVALGTDGVLNIPEKFETATAKMTLTVEEVLKKTVGTDDPTPAMAGIVLQTPAKGAKMASIMGFSAVKKLDTLTDGRTDEQKAANNPTIPVTFNGEKVATLAFTETGVTITNETTDRSIAYDNGTKWVTVGPKKSTKEITTATPGNAITIKVLGVKATPSFGSDEGDFTNPIVKSSGSEDQSGSQTNPDEE